MSLTPDTQEYSALNMVARSSGSQNDPTASNENGNTTNANLALLPPAMAIPIEEPAECDLSASPEKEIDTEMNRRRAAHRAAAHRAAPGARLVAQASKWCQV